MISFHPTLSPRSLLRYLSRPAPESALRQLLKEKFPDTTPVLTDSGRSALAVIIESLNLRGKKLLVPAYVCDSLFPVFTAYDITPIFLDVDPTTYQPPLTAYTEEKLADADAALVVATYGRPPDAVVMRLLESKHMTIIEDYAARHPGYGEPLRGQARLYSLPKTLPVPDGGLALLPANATAPTLPPAQRSLSWYKNVSKLLPGMAPLIARLRGRVQTNQTAPSWSKSMDASRLTQKILTHQLPLLVNAPTWTKFPYCVPLQTTQPPKLIAQLRKKCRVSAEPVWHQPIIMSPDVQKSYQLDLADFPNTTALAQKIVCAPLWHITEEETFVAYETELQKTAAEVGSE